jgi:hypothetical protein
MFIDLNHYMTVELVKLILLLVIFTQTIKYVFFPEIEG